MKRKKPLLIFSLFGVLLVSFGMGLMAEKVPAEVLQAARDGIFSLPRDLSPQASQDNPVVRYGFQVYTVSPSQLLKSRGISSGLSQTGLWRFVVENQGKPAALITVAEIDGQWKAVAIGGAQLAVEVARVMERWPEAQGYSHRFARFYQARVDFIEVSGNGKVIGFVPLTASRLAFGMEGTFDPAALLHDSEIMPRLQKAAVDTINEEK